MTQFSVKQLFIYPIKSTAAIELTTTQIDQFGCYFDRRFVVCDMSGHFITARTHPRLCLIESQLLPAGLKLTAPHMEPLLLNTSEFSPQYQEVTVWKDTISAQLCSEKANEWFSRYLQQPSQLFFYANHSQRTVKNRSEFVSFADGYPLLLIGQASLDELNQQLDMPVTIRQFRPNIVSQSHEPFVEDGWKKIKIGSVIFDVVKPCSRCVFTTVNPRTASIHKHNEPLATLMKYRQSEHGDVMFGQNIIPLNQGSISVHDPIEVLAQQNRPVYIDKRKNITEKPQQTNNIQMPSKSKKVNILFDGWDTFVEGNNQETLLEQGENAGLILPFSCRSGLCGRCKVSLESGEVIQLATDGLSEQDKQKGYVLACSCIPTSDVVINHSD